MYKKIIKGIKNPDLAKNKLYRGIEYPFKRLQKENFRREYGSGIDVFDEEWDNLILLDACRSDVFSQEIELSGDLSTVVSAGSNSWEFMEANFAERQLHDTIYVTSNPHYYKLSKDVFYTVDDVLSEWDEKTGTVYPEDVVDHALSTYNEYPEKRLIIHFMQPHIPYLGPTANRVRDRVDIRGFRRYHGPDGSRGEGEGVSWWSALRNGKISEEETKQAYRESLNIVLSHVEELVSELNGKSVISSDHGELLGEKITPITPPRYGHGYTHNEELCIVPWFETNYDERRTITSEEPIGYESTDDDIINSRLKSLGYKPE